MANDAEATTSGRMTVEDRRELVKNRIDQYSQGMSKICNQLQDRVETLDLGEIDLLLEENMVIQSQYKRVQRILLNEKIKRVSVANEEDKENTLPAIKEEVKETVEELASKIEVTA